jgi:cysteine desulfurase
VRIYLDHNATSPLHPEVRAAMARILGEVFGNPSSTHAEGAAARAELERARARTARLVNVEPGEVVFTAGATEANNSALRGLLRPGDHVVTSAVEHPSVDEPLRMLEERGCAVTRIPVDAEGRVDAAAFAAAFRPETVLASVILANNESGVIQPVAELAELARERGARFHVDATQAVGKLPVDVAQLGVDLLAASAHKFNGPKGAGFLVVRGQGLEPLLCGGPQERRRRGGTENLAGIVGLGVAAELAARDLAARRERYAALRDRLWQGIEAKVPRVRRNGSAEHVLPNTLNVEFQGTAGEVLLEALDLEGVAISAGAACASGSIEPSHVLVAMGRTPAEARGSLRFSVGHGNTESEIDRVLAILPDLVARVRSSVSA